jgi:phosphatidylserine/phosphatidylglycerophosphate/cardiolipin synthase-like enzyme
MNAEVDVKIDRHIGDFFLQRLKDAKQRLWIMSPWIASEYVDILLAKKAEGVDVRVITTNDYGSGQKEALRKLVEPQVRILKPENRGLKYTGVGLIVLGVLLVGATKGSSLFLSLIGVALYMFGREKKETYYISTIGDGNLVVLQFHPYSIVHAKIYIADDMVIMGSANFTANGLQNSIEGMVTMQNAELATNVGEMMGKVKNSMNLTTISYNTVGRDVNRIDPERKYHRNKKHSSRW